MSSTGMANRLFSSINSGSRLHNIPFIKTSVEIPKIIHQTFCTENLPQEFRKNVNQLKIANPGWEHRFYTDADVKQFILEQYGSEILAYFERINPKYGAARADLFRYLLMYRYGGVYLDIKSTFIKPIDDVLQPGDQYLLAGWRNRIGEEHEGIGLQKELSKIADGEFQQWHILAVPGHPFLRAVIETVLTNIDNYKPWLHGTGQMGVLRLTGPIAYTLAIHPLLDLHTHRRVRIDVELGLKYSTLTTGSHKSFFKNHYVTLTESIIKMGGVEQIIAHLYSFAKKVLNNVRS